MPGAIASVACANGKIHHFVCVKKDGTLGHVIATFDNEDKLTWSMGDLAGQAHQLSQIVINCRDKTADPPSLDVLYQNSSFAVVAMERPAGASSWSNRGEFSSLIRYRLG